MTRILVTGASGFVGRPLVAALAQHGHAVRALSRRVLRFPADVDVVQIIDGDGAERWRNALADVDVVVHLAGIAHAGRGIAPEAYDRVNRQMTSDLARAAAASGVGRFIFVSSIRAQSGAAANHMLTEADAPQPTDDYGRSKLAAEAAVKASGVPFTIFRPVLIYGPGVKGNFATLMRLAASPWPLPLAAFANRRSLLALDNLIAAIEFAIATPATINEIYLVGDPTPLSLAEIVAILRSAAGRQPRLFAVPPAILHFALRSLGRSDLWNRIGGELVIDCTKLRSAGWRPVVDSREGLAAMA